jgi:hypothetical protein
MSRAVMLALLLSLLSCTSSGPKTDSTTAPGADIPGYKTFGWSSATAQAPTTILESNIHDAIRAQLLAKGYVEADDAPDFRVAFDVSSYETTKRSSPVRIGVGVGTWGGNVGGSVGTSVPVGGSGGESTTNRLTIRAVDAKSTKEVWVGTTTSDIKQGLDRSAVNQAVAATMKSFPRRRSS